MVQSQDPDQENISGPIDHDEKTNSDFNDLNEINDHEEGSVDKKDDASKDEDEDEDDMTSNGFA